MILLSDCTAGTGEKAFPGSTRRQALLSAVPGFGGLPLGEVQAHHSTHTMQAKGAETRGRNILQGSCTLPFLVFTPACTLTAGRVITIILHQ